MKMSSCSWEKKRINFDHPDSIEWPLLVEQLDALRSGRTVQMPIYSYVTCARSPETIEVQPGKVIILEGILILGNMEVRDRLDIKVYVDAVALSYLEGVEIDYQTQGANASFVFKNVFANTGGSGVCGACGAAGGGCG